MKRGRFAHELGGGGEDPMREMIRSRINDYETRNVDEERRHLVDLWRTAYPEAEKETSIYLHPLIKVADNRLGKFNRNIPADQPDEVWANDIYIVTLRRHDSDPVFKTNRMIQLGVSTHDGSARHDWRDFQSIKNQLVGPDCEAFELYPAESRLLDPSNYYLIWCFPELIRIRVGSMDERYVCNADFAAAPQRRIGFSQEVEFAKLKQLDVKRASTVAEMMVALDTIQRNFKDHPSAQIAMQCLTNIHKKWQDAIDEMNRVPEPKELPQTEEPTKGSEEPTVN